MASPEDMTRTMIRNMPVRTGRSLDEWVKLARTAPEQSHNKILVWLKSEHGLTHGYANLATTALLSPAAIASNRAASQAEYLSGQYAGKPRLRPIHDRLIALASALGPDVEISVKKSYVSLRRRKQFAMIKPSTKTRVDLGLCLRGVECQRRLEAAETFSAMVSHRVRLGGIEDVDGEVADWLRMAY